MPPEEPTTTSNFWNSNTSPALTAGVIVTPVPVVARKSTPLLCFTPFKNTSISPTSYPSVIVKSEVVVDTVSNCLVIVEARASRLIVTVLPEPTTVSIAVPVKLMSVNAVPTRVDPD